MILRTILYLFVCILFTLKINAQDYKQSIAKHRESYKSEFLNDTHSPLKKEDLSYLRFYEANVDYLVHAKFTKVLDTTGFDMLTHSKVIKKYFKYGFITFTLQKKEHILFIYQSKTLSQQAELADYLFIPFTDLTNSKSTFGGGRYIDIRMNEIVDNKLVLDFNKCYNPYCAYAGGYSCPIPPEENKMKIYILAGEKNFGKPVKE